MREAKQVICMRTDLNMRKGKMIAQGAHASMLFLVGKVLIGSENFTGSQLAWLQGIFTKICVRVESEDQLLEIHRLAQEAGLSSSLIKDSGRTEFNGVPTYTCLAIGPNWSDDIDKITGHLKLL